METQTPRRWRPGLVSRFAAASLVAFAAVGGAVSFVAHQRLIEQAEGDAQFHARFVTDSVLRYTLSGLSLSRPLTGDAYARLDRLVHRRILKPPVVRVKIWSTDGTILYSDARSLVGRRFPDEAEENAAFRSNRSVSESSDASEPENVAERHFDQDLFSTYVPLYLHQRQSGPPDAVVELYQDRASIEAQADALLRKLALAMGAGLLVLYALLLPIAARASRTLRRTNEELAERRERLEVLLAREQQTVLELRRLNQLQSDFVAIASHELRSPLTAILGYVKTLRREEFERDPTARQEFLAAIERQGDRLFRLIMNLLTASQVESGTAGLELSLVDVRQLVATVTEGFHESAGRVRLDMPDDLPLVETDQVRLGEVIANLVDNALKYSPADTSVDVGARSDGDRARVWIRDRGVGVAPEMQEQIFERFFQVDQTSTRRYGGVGLGLHLVAELTRSLGGTVSLDSRLGAGSTFTVTVPIRRDRESALAGASWRPRRDAVPEVAGVDA